MKEIKISNKKDFLRKHLGNMSQLAGVKKYRLCEGRAEGVCAIEVRTGAGFTYTVLPDRGMDIAWADYKGVPIAYMSATGVSAGAYYESEGTEWLRNFFAGFLTTCGFSNVGGACEEEHPIMKKRRFGMHGRATNLPASEVCTQEEWKNGRYVMCISGKTRESIVFGENITLRREFTSYLGENKFSLHDRIENESNREQPLMLLYHMNMGYPLLSESTRLLIASETVKGTRPTAQAEIAEYARFHEPRAGYAERCYYHRLKADKDGKTYIAVVNDELELAVLFTYELKQLPCLTEWKLLGEGEYVLGIEPGISYPDDRVETKRMGALPTLGAGETRDVEIEVEILDGKEAIERAEKKIREI